HGAHVHVHAGVVTDHAAGIDVDALARGQLALHHAAAGVDEHPAVALELLHDEPLAAEQAGEDLALEVHAHLHAARAGQEAVLLADDAAAVFVELHRQHGARVRRGEGHPGLAAAGVGEHGGEQAFAGDHALAGRQQLVHQAAALALARAIAEQRVHLHGGVLEHHRAGLGDRALAGIELDLHDRHFLAVDAELDVVGTAAPAAGRRRRHRGRIRGRAVHQFGNAAHRKPAAHAFAPGQERRRARGFRAGRIVVEGAQAAVAGLVVQVPLAHSRVLVREEAKVYRLRAARIRSVARGATVVARADVGREFRLDAQPGCVPQVVQGLDARGGASAGSEVGDATGVDVHEAVARAQAV